MSATDTDAAGPLSRTETAQVQDALVLLCSVCSAHGDAIQAVQAFGSCSSFSASEAGHDMSLRQTIIAVPPAPHPMRIVGARLRVDVDPSASQELDQLCRELPVPVLVQFAPPPPPSAGSRTVRRVVGHQQL